MKDIEYEKEKAREMLNLIEQYEAVENKKEINEDLNILSDELYYKKQSVLSQDMIDIALAIHSFTQAASSGGPIQPLDEFIPDLKKVIEG